MVASVILFMSRPYCPYYTICSGDVQPGGADVVDGNQLVDLTSRRILSVGSSALDRVLNHHYCDERNVT